MNFRARIAGRWIVPSTMALALLMAFAAPVLAAGDDIAADGDGVLPITPLGQMQLGNICLGEEITRTALVAGLRISFSGLFSWQNSAAVTVSVNTVLGSGLSATVPASPDNQFTTPSNWNQLGDNTITPEYVVSTIRLTPDTLGSFLGSVTYDGTGLRVSGGGNHTETGGFNVFANVVQCPTIAITTPAQDAQYVIGSSVAADYECTSDSAITKCDGPVADTANIDTQTVGVKSFKVDAEDADGDASSETVTYRVVYPFEFVAPTAELPGGNQAVAGQKLKVRFSMDGYHGPSVLTAWPRHRRVDCSTGAPITNNTVHRISRVFYNSNTDQYVVTWKTRAAWAGTCRDFSVRLQDGTTHVARFHLEAPNPI